MKKTVSYYTPDEYLALDEAAPEGIRLEYWKGNLFAQGQHYRPHDTMVSMAGGTPTHNQICTNLLTFFNLTLPDACFIAGSDQRIEVVTGQAYTYPDVVVACDARFEKTTLQNPQLLVEVLSSSTADRDQGIKLDYYLALPSLLEYWIVNQDQALVRQYYRGTEDWGLRFYHDLEATISSVHFNFTVRMADIYRRISL